MNFTEKENYNFNDLVEIVKILSCPRRLSVGQRTDSQVNPLKFY